jgi:hypothetical protein
MRRSRVTIGMTAFSFAVNFAISYIIFSPLKVRATSAAILASRSAETVGSRHFTSPKDKKAGDSLATNEIALTSPEEFIEASSSYSSLLMSSETSQQLPAAAAMGVLSSALYHSQVPTISLSSSPCLPEIDGYFGATSGTPLMIQYKFELVMVRKTVPASQTTDDIVSALNIIHQTIIRTVIAQTFPSICGQIQEENSILTGNGHTRKKQRQRKRKSRIRNLGPSTDDDVNRKSTIGVVTSFESLNKDNKAWSVKGLKFSHPILEDPTGKLQSMIIYSYCNP